MRPVWKKVLDEDQELWLGIPTWDRKNVEGFLSVKYAYRKNGRVPRSAPEVPEEVAVEMVLMLGENRRLSQQQLEKLEQMVKRLRPPA